MKTNVKMIDKSKNSFIYFQLGLIATMVAVLFVLEYNFETIEKHTVYSTPNKPIVEEVYRYNPAKEIAKTEPVKKVVVKTIVKPVVLPKVINQFKETKEYVKNDVVKNAAHQDTKETSKSTNDDKNKDNNSKETTTSEPKDEVFVAVEFLPRFPSCVNVSKENQKECFDNALRNEINKHLKYPERDLENNKEGTVFVQFIIDENGNFTSIKSAENNRSTDEMKKAVESAVKKLPKIIPARQGKIDVKVIYTMPITFKINK